MERDELMFRRYGPYGRQKRQRESQWPAYQYERPQARASASARFAGPKPEPEPEPGLAPEWMTASAPPQLASPIQSPPRSQSLSPPPPPPPPRSRSLSRYSLLPPWSRLWSWSSLWSSSSSSSSSVSSVEPLPPMCILPPELRRPKSYSLPPSIAISGGPPSPSPSPPPPPSPPPSTPPSPSWYREELRQYLQLYRAVVKSDWESVRSLLDADPAEIRFNIRSISKKVLRIAAETGKTIDSRQKLLDGIRTLEELKILTEKEEDTVENKDFRKYLPLHSAVVKGDMVKAKSFLDNDAIMAKITNMSGTVLHVAVETGAAIDFVDDLLGMIHELENAPEDNAPKDILENLTDALGETALHYAAIFNNIEAAKLLVKKCRRLPYTMNKSGLLPLHVAGKLGHRTMVSHLMTVVTRDDGETSRDDGETSTVAGKPDVKLLNLVIVAEFYDVALQLVLDNPELATSTEPSTGSTALCMLARKPSAFPSGRHLSFWERFIYSCVHVKSENNSKESSGGDVENPDESSQLHAQRSCWVRFFIPVCQKLRAVLWDVIERLVPQIKQLKDLKTTHDQARQLLELLCTKILLLDTSEATSIFKGPLLVAAELGIHEVVEQILESFPSAIWSLDKKGRDIFQLAVLNRRENVFKLLYEMNAHRHLVAQTVDYDENSILHLAGILAPPRRLTRVSGPAMEMQRELQWYKEVEKLTPPYLREQENSFGKTPAMVFTEEHEKLVKEAEKWMRDTTNSCSIAAALIATVAFAAAVTVPGGNNAENGLPIFSKEKAFLIFSVSNALSLFSSMTWLLMFLSILTARYTEADFLHSLPQRLIIGLVTLFLSIASMMVTFCAALYIVFGHQRAWLMVLVATSASLPVTFFMYLQFPLLMDMILSTYGPGIFKKKKVKVLQ